MDRSDYLMVAALDLGPTFSGYAISFRSNFGTNQPIIYCNQIGSDESHQRSVKTQACVLLDENKELKTFGYDAETTFSDIREEGNQDDYYFFRGFNTNKNITRDMILIDETGKSLLASHVFKMFVKAFVNDLMETLNKRGVDFKKDSIIWVIPVSSDQTGTSTQLLRSCAEQAGIPSDQLMFKKEAEASFMYCAHLPGRDHYQHIIDGTECMIVQLAGSFADITVLKKENNQVIEIYWTTGNECGGYMNVYDSFLKFLIRIFGSQFMTSFREEEPSAFFKIEREFETIIKDGKGSRSGRIAMMIPYCTMDCLCKKYLAEDLREVINSSIYRSDVSLKGDKIRLSSDLFHNFFKPTIDRIIYLMKQVFADYQDSHKVTTIVMVGYFSESGMVQEAVRQTFPTKKIIIPNDPGLAVISGSVLCGHQPCQYKQISSSEMKAAQTSVTQCIFCDNSGVYHCTECKLAFCQLCRTKHDKLPTMKSHTVTELKKIDPSAFSSNAICVSHNLEFIYFCTRCHVLICGKCVTTEHKCHDITDIKTVAEDYRSSAEKDIADFKVAVTRISNAVEHMKAIEKPTLRRKAKSSVAEMEEAVKKITKAVSFTKEKILDEAQNQLAIELKEFQYDLKNKERIYEHQKKIFKSLERLMHVSHDITFITSYETLKRDIHDISDFVGERGQKKVYKFDKKGLVQEVVNAIVSDFEMSLVGMQDGSVVLMNKTKTQKEKE